MENERNEEEILFPYQKNECGLKEVHEEYLNMLDDFHGFCIDHGIKYSLSGGTLLGAIRHHGFIPWDDDADVMFERKNYEEFLKAFNKYPMSEYEVLSCSWMKRVTRKDNPLKEKEKQCLDLFVFDPVPPNKAAAKLKIFFIKMIRGMLKDKPKYKRYSLPYKCFLFVTWAIGRPIPQKTKVRWYNDLCKVGKNNKKINIYNTWFDQISRLEYDKHIIDDYIFLDFEGRKYMAIQGYDSYLRELYGDYMQLPPEEKRKPSHMKQKVK